MTNPQGRDQAMRSLEHEIAVLLRRARRGISERAALFHPDLNVAAYSMLIALSDLGPQRAADLADVLALDKGAVSRQVHLLIELGLIERAPDPDDGRASILAVSDLFRSRLAEVEAMRRTRLDARLASWEPDAIDDLAQTLGRFNATFAE